MKIVHHINNKEITGEGNHKFLLTNKKGSYALFGSQESDFDGYFTYDVEDDSLFKIIHDIHSSSKPNSLTNYFTRVERTNDCCKEDFILTSNALIVLVKGEEQELTITLDTKKLYDESTQGRIYSCKVLDDQEGTSIIIHYEKFSDNSLTHKDYERFIAITVQGATVSGANNQKLTKEEKKDFGVWRETSLTADARRGMQATRYVYDAIKVQTTSDTKIFITSSSRYDKVQEKLSYVTTHQNSIIAANNNYPIQRFKDKEPLQAIAEHALDSLITKLKNRMDRGVFAGLPWFFQYWMRDEAITCGALIGQEHYALVKEILLRWTKEIKAKHTTAHNSSTLQARDGPGIVAKRIHDLLKHLGLQVNNYFSQEELCFIKESFDEYIEKSPFDENGFIINQEKETWMDTAPQGMNRSGIRVEIQCLQLCIYELQEHICNLTNKEPQAYKQKKDDLLLNIRKSLFLNNRLIDGLFIDNKSDFTIRPNIFLAHYFYPNLLSKQEWEQSFDSALDSLFLSWGGLSSIDTNNELFQDQHTGVNNKSYHQGDSWYFINNIAAKAMFEVNAHKYYEAIHKIFEASKKDLLFLGAIGHASEISDANSQTGTGCLSQAWSAATFIELLNIMRRE